MTEPRAHDGMSGWRSLGTAQRHVVLSSLAGLALLFFDQTAVIVALPAIGADFGSPPAATQWVVTSYLLALAVFMPLAGRVADRYGRKRVLIVGLLLFGIGSAACAAANTLLLLMIFRFVQGVGAAVMQPLALAAGTRDVPANRRGWVIGLLSTGGTTFLILGPLIAAGVLSVGTWRWLFVINLPVLAFAIYQAIRWFVPTAERGADVQWGQASLLGAALLTTVLGVSQLASRGLIAVLLVVVGGGLLTWFVGLQSRTTTPLIPLRYLADRILATCLVALFTIQFVVLGSMVALVTYLERGMSETALTAGIVVAAAGVFTPLLSTFTGRAADRSGPRILVVGGLVLATIGLGALAIAGPALDLLWLAPGLLLFSLSRPAVFTPASVAPFATLPTNDRAFAASLVTEARQLGAVMGVAVTGLTADAFGGPAPGRAVAWFVVTLAVLAGAAGAAAAVTARWMPTSAHDAGHTN